MDTIGIISQRIMDLFIHAFNRNDGSVDGLSTLRNGRFKVKVGNTWYVITVQEDL